MSPETAKLLWDMLVAARRIAEFASGKRFDDYLHDILLRSAIERQFEIIGEAMTRLAQRDPQTAGRISEVRKIRGFRNALVHGYDTIDHTVTWSVVQQKLPILLRELEQLLPGGGR